MTSESTEPSGRSIGEYFESVARLTRDLRNASITLSDAEVRFLVDGYYVMQRDRIRAAHQQRTLAENAEPHEVINWLTSQAGILEKQIARALDAYSASVEAGRWARTITGIGPVIAAGLVAHLDIKQAPTVGHFWRFAGLDPTVKWTKETKRPWNGKLKRLMWIIGESFTKVSGLENDIYGKIYKARKELEVSRNEKGLFADQAAAALREKKFRADTDARKHYEAGRLPPARIHLRAQRYAVKIFISHLHHVMHEIEYGKPPPKPFILTQPNHAHFIGPPNWPME
jgi:hypothetical protein